MISPAVLPDLDPSRSDHSPLDVEIRRNRICSLSQYRTTVIIAFNGSHGKDRIYCPNVLAVDLGESIWIMNDYPISLPREIWAKKGNATVFDSRNLSRHQAKTPRFRGAFVAFIRCIQTGSYQAKLVFRL